MEIPKMSCPYCSASWIPRVSDPVRCPRCWRTLEPRKKVEGDASSSLTPNQPKTPTQLEVSAK